jgi:hypothetical protein
VLAVGVAAGPEGFEAESITILKPVGALLDRGLLQVVGEWGLARSGDRAGENVTAGAGDTRKAKG